MDNVLRPHSPSQAADDGSHVLAVPPPLTPNALRISVLARLDKYLTLHAASVNGTSSLDVSNPANHQTTQLRMIQSALIRQMKELYYLSLELERQLLGRRRRVWAIHTSLALVSHVLLVRLVSILAPARPALEMSYRQPLGLKTRAIVFPLLQLSAYPIAFYNIAVLEKRITETKNLRRDLSTMMTSLEQGAPVEDRSCLSPESWKYIPWESLRDGL